MPYTARRADEVHLSGSEAFDVRLQDCWPLELVDDVP